MSSYARSATKDKSVN